METEFKYNLEDTSIFDSIVETAGANKMGLEAVEVIDMQAAYFDTEDFDFRKKGIAYRIRQEDDRCTATIKWDVNVKEGLHRREEFNLVVNDERFARQYARKLLLEKRMARRAAVFELTRKGIDRATAEAVLEEIDVDPRENIRAVLDKKYRSLQDEKTKRRAVAALQRLGYGWDDIRAVLEEYD